MHTEWLHGHFAEFVHEKRARKCATSRAHREDRASTNSPYGIIKRRLLEGQTEDCDDWAVGHPVVFPNILAVGSADVNWPQYAFQIRVPIDDTHTRHYWYNAFVPPPGARRARSSCSSRSTSTTCRSSTSQGEYLLAHDPCAGHHGVGDARADRRPDARRRSARPTAGITLYRKMLCSGRSSSVAAGADPKCVIRDPAQNDVIELPLERQLNARTNGFARSMRRHNVRFSHQLDDLIALFEENPAEAATAGR